MRKKLLTLFTLATLILSQGVTLAQASEMTDDPGAGRLSGNNIPKEWYDETNTTAINVTPSSRSLVPYGSSTTVNPFTGKTYTHQDVFDGKTILHGIDVSQWNRTIDWAKVKAAGIDYAFIRVGYRGYGKAGTLQYPYTDDDGKYKYGTKDPYYEQNMQGAIAAGVKVGIYIFSQAITEKEAQEEAKYILDHIGNYAITMPLIMDYEYASDASDGGRIKTANLSKEEATKICMAFCKTIADAGYTPMVYANKNMLELHLDAPTISAKYPIWLANYTENTTYAGTFQFWQYSSDGKVDGIEGRTDMNYYYATPGDNYAPNIENIATATIAPIPDQAYTGNAVTPALTITSNGKVLTPNVNYTLSYKNNKNLGTATVTIIGKTGFKGTKTTTFRIIPKMVSKFRVKKQAETSITLSWSKMSDATGYEIFRSTAANGSYQKIATIKKNSTKSYTDTDLSSGQCYYYKIRCYKKVAKTTHYGIITPAKEAITKISYTRNAVVTKAINLYSEPFTGASIVQPLAVGNKFSITYYTKDATGAGWYRVSSKKATGFIPSSAVKVEKLGKITTSDVNLRKSPSTSSKVVTQMKKNTKVTIEKTKIKKGLLWYKVTFKQKKKTYKGWVASPYMKPR